MNSDYYKAYFKPKSYRATFGHGLSSDVMLLTSASQTVGRRFRRGRERGSGEQIKKVEIYDAQIKLLKSTELESAEIEIGINYKPGIYGVKVYLENGESKWFKLVKL